MAYGYKNKDKYLIIVICGFWPVPKYQCNSYPGILNTIINDNIITY